MPIDTKNINGVIISVRRAGNAICISLLIILPTKPEHNQISIDKWNIAEFLWPSSHDGNDMFGQLLVIYEPGTMVDRWSDLQRGPAPP